jgi:hypothetical protein
VHGFIHKQMLASLFQAGGVQAPVKIAMREATEPCERRPKALLASSVEIEARLE